MTTSHDLADAVGRKKIADALGVLPTAVSNAVVRGWFPSSWFLVVKSMADQVGQDCPPELFKMRVSDTPNVDASRARQPAPVQKGKHGKRVGA
ncbi:hypothetical protein [Paracoccus hibiscisoli]|uniref:hypothetical protein n=1 Tax=Paracoccus hibiscisoli TaxID=2023261 RepID=UPI0023F40D50|nr:hypothetical protein [Paracoccus hibiscisoli]